MDNAELIALYNPANAHNLTAEQVKAMAEITNDQLDALAKAYPNSANQRPYLVLHDNNVREPNRQLYPLSTWQNLRNVRKMNGLNNLVPFTFRSLFSPSTAKTQQQLGGGRKVAANKETVDLTAKEAAEELRRTLKEKQGISGENGQKGQVKTAAQGNKSPRKRNVPASTTTVNQQAPDPVNGEQPQGELPADQTEQSIV
jgi:hypothetical protein